MTAAAGGRFIDVKRSSIPRVGGVVRAAAESATRNSIALVAVVVAAIVYCARSLVTHEHFLTNAWDLGIFGQGVKGYAAGTGPISQLEGSSPISLLGDHFSPVDALLGPVYLLFPSIAMLLVAQALLIAAGAYPLVSWARRDLGRWQAIAVAVIYTTSFGIASAIGYDFHEVAWAVPMLSISLCALGQGRFGMAAAAALPLVLVKEDLGMTVAAVGFVILLRGRRRLGVALMVFGVAATLIEVKVLLPMFNPHGSYAHADVLTDLSPLGLVHAAVAGADVKVTTVLLTLAVGAFVGTRSTLMLVAIPTLVWRMLGSNSTFWTMKAQYSVVLMPILVAALIEVLVRYARSDRGGLSFQRWALAASIAISLALGATMPLADLLKPGFWRPDSRLAAEQAAVAAVPRNSTVAATNFLVPHLVDTDTVSLLTTAAVDQRPEWIAADLTTDVPYPSAAQAAAVARARALGYVQVFEDEDVVVLKRP